MFAAYAARFAEDALSGLEVGELPEPATPEGWVRVEIRAAALNRHDLWSLRGVGLREQQLPMVLGCDAAGIDADGNDVVVYPVVGDPDWRGDETLDPRRTLLSEKYPGTLATSVTVPARNVLAKPAELSLAEAACLPTAWLTAYRMLFTRADLRPGDTVLVQGAGGGVSTALVALGAAAGFRVWVTGRDEGRRQRAVELGADAAYESGARLPAQVDAVMESVGAATWSHSIKSLRPGGTVVICGATSGDAPESAELTRLFFQQKSVVGSTMGTRDELAGLLSFLAQSGVRPVIDRELPLARAAEGLRALDSGDVFGKIVLTVDA